jgi:hypothetical protein
MVNKRNWLGILALVLVFGMMVVGCEDGSDNGDSGGGGEPHKITITGISNTIFNRYKYADIALWSSSFWENDKIGVLEARGEYTEVVSGDYVTISLIKGQIINYNDRWWSKNNGSYYIQISFNDKGYGGGGRTVYYTNGKSFQELGITMDDWPNSLSKLPKYTINGTTTTIDMSKFVN